MDRNFDLNRSASPRLHHGFSSGVGSGLPSEPDRFTARRRRQAPTLFLIRVRTEVQLIA